MPFDYNMGDSMREATLDVQRLNKWTDRIVPEQGTTQRLSGSGAQLTNQLSESVLYVIVSKHAMNLSSGGTDLLTASVSDQYWPANEPIYHFVKSGSTDYVSVIETGGGSIDCFISVVEHTKE